MEGYIQRLRELQRNSRLPEALKIISDTPQLESQKDPELNLLTGLIYLLSGMPEKASPFFERISFEDIKSDDGKADYALFRFLTGDYEEAINILKEILKKNPSHFISHARLSAIYLSIDQIKEAEPHLIKALEIEPNRAELLSNLATLRMRQGRYNEAIELIDRAIKANPSLESLKLKKAKFMLALNKAEDYIDELYETISKEPDNPSNYIILAQLLLNMGKEEESISIISAALDKFEDNEEVKKAYISILLNTERYWELGSKLKEWVEEKPDSIELRFLLNQARIKAGFLETAERDLEEMSEEHKREPQWKILKSQIFSERNQADKAIELLEEVIDDFPGHIEARQELAHLLLSIGRKKDAQKQIDAIKQISPNMPLVKVYYSDEEVNEETIRQLEEIFNNPLTPVQQKISVGFTLAELYERLGEYEKSFKTVSKANELTKSITRYDWKEHRSYVQRIMAVFDKDLIRRFRGLGHPSRRPIFIVSMPRSGTTLLEQILASHPDVYGAGELPWIGRLTTLFPKVTGRAYPEGMRHIDERRLKNAGEYYLEKLNLYNTTSPHVTDKLPHNFDHLGFIRLIFPNAPIIHIKRNPFDVAISNFYQNFAALRGTMGFANDLEDIGHMLNDYFAIMNHWREVLDGDFLEVEYEELVSEPERTIREVLKYCGLEWDDRVLRFYKTERPVKTASIKQVREGIYRKSVERWKRYEKFLIPLKKILEEGFKPI